MKPMPIYMPLAYLLEHWVPGSHDQPWTWDDEERDLLTYVGPCGGVPGHYYDVLERFIATEGEVRGVCLGPDGRVWDGHHRLIAARRLGFEYVGFVVPEAGT